MKLRTSFFNLSVLRKNLTRFAPLWVLYAIAEVLCLLTLDLHDPDRVADNINTIMGPVGIFHMGYALIVAACLFGDLFDSRMCNGLHAMPMKREGWLLTNLASGFVFALIPAVVGGTVAAIAMQEYYWMSLVWQGVSLLQFVLFFGIAVFSAMCAGKRLGMVAIYALINFLAYLILVVVSLIYQPLLPGVVLSDENFFLFTPVIQMANQTFVNYYYDCNLGGFFRGFIGESWTYLYICAGVGILFMAASWVLYRKRHLETAGDFISFRPVKIVFLLAYTFAVGALVYSFSGLFFGRVVDYGFLVTGILIGWFTGWMLLERTAKIFTPKVLVSFVAFALLFAGSIGLTVWDPAGVVTYVPNPERVSSACMYLLNDAYRYDKNHAGYEGWYITDGKEIAMVQSQHRAMLETVDEPCEKCIPVGVQYQLTNGTIVRRSYDVPVESGAAEALNAFFNDPRALLHTADDWDTIQKNVRTIEIHWYDDKLSTTISSMQEQQMEEFLGAIEADCLAGTLFQQHYLHEEYDSLAGITITWEDQQYGVRSEYFIVFDSCEHLCGILKDM